jgi:uncharacterized OsmC-like protein
MAEQTTINVVNGLELNVLQQTLEAVEQDPTLGESRFHIHNKWVKGGRNQSKVDGFYGAGQEISHLQTFVLNADEPPILAGQDSAANPVEHLLHALAGCLTSSIVYHAAVEGIEIEELESKLEGDLDIRGFTGISPDVRKGYKNVRVTFRIKTNHENLDDLKALMDFSPVLDTVRNGTDVKLEIERL